MPSSNIFASLRKFLIFAEKYSKDHPEFLEAVEAEFGAEGTQKAAKKPVVKSLNPLDVIKASNRKDIEAQLSEISDETIEAYAKYLKVKLGRGKKNYAALRSGVADAIEGIYNHGSAFGGSAK